MKSPNEIYKILKKAFIDDDFSINANFYGYDHTETHEFKQNNFNVSFGYSYNAYTHDFNNDDRDYPGDKEAIVSNIEIIDLEVSFNGEKIDFSDDDNEDLKEILLITLQNENS